MIELSWMGNWMTGCGKGMEVAETLDLLEPSPQIPLRRSKSRPSGICLSFAKIPSAWKLAAYLVCRMRWRSRPNANDKQR